MKIRGFTIKGFDNLNQVTIKRKQVSLTTKGDRWVAYSYNDKGFKVLRF